MNKKNPLTEAKETELPTKEPTQLDRVEGKVDAIKDAVVELTKNIVPAIMETITRPIVYSTAPLTVRIIMAAGLPWSTIEP